MGSILEEAISPFSFLRRRKIITELRACVCLEKGKIIHESAVKTGDDSNVYVASTLIKMYGKCGCMKDAQKVFDRLDLPDVVCWNALILGYADNGEADVALDLFSAMRCKGAAPDARTFVAASVACSYLAARNKGETSGERGNALHLLSWTVGCGDDVYLKNNLVDMYAKCGEMEKAVDVFRRIIHPDVIAWTALIFGYADCGKGIMALKLLSQMELESCMPNARTFVAALKACGDLAVKQGQGNTASGRKLHLIALRNGCDLDTYVQGSLVDMYAKCRDMENSRLVFEKIKHPDVVSWTALIFGYAVNGESQTALWMFSRMRCEGCAPDAGCFVAALKACANLVIKEGADEKLASGNALHLLASRNGWDSDVYLKNILVDMYAKCGSMKDAQRVFDSVILPDVVCWNGLISGYVTNGKAKTSLDLFAQMKREGCIPDAGTFVAILKACMVLGTYEIGRTFHADICAQGLETDSVVRNCLVDLYVKSGSLLEAEKLFDSQTTDTIPWNSLIAGYSRLGDAESALRLFDEMCDKGIQPDGITLKCILTVCGHSGLVERGKDHFETMRGRFGITADIEHYNCMMDILGRANKLDEMMMLSRSMPFILDVVTWTTVLSACRKWKNVGLGELAFESLISLDEGDSGAYALMANIYGVWIS